MPNFDPTQDQPGSSGGPYIIFNADKTGATDATAALQNALQAAYNANAQTVWAPAGTYLIKGQIYGPNSSMPGNTPNGATAPTIRLLGAGSGYQSGSSAVKSTQFDCRWDGGISSTTYNNFVNDWSVVQGLVVVQGSSATQITIASGGYAYIGNNAGVGSAPTHDTTGIVNQSTAACNSAGAWFVDYDLAGGVTFTQSLTWTASKIRLAQLITSDGAGTIARIINMRSHPGKFDFRAYGKFIIQNCCFTRLDNPTADEIPFIKTTSTTLNVEKCYFLGSQRAAVGVAALQDGIVFGGKGSPLGARSGSYVSETTTAYSVGGQYTSQIRDNMFTAIRDCVVLGGNANENVIDGNNFYSWCGNGQGGGAVVIDALSQNFAYGNKVTNNSFECGYYAYAINCKNNALRNYFAGNGFSDPTFASLAANVGGGDTQFQINNPGQGNILQWKGQTLVIDGGNDAVREYPTASSGAISGTAMAHAATVSGAAGASALVLESGTIGDFTAGLILLVGDGSTTQEMVTVGAGASGTNIPVTAPPGWDTIRQGAWSLQNTYLHASPAGITQAPWTVQITGSTNSIGYPGLGGASFINSHAATLPTCYVAPSIAMMRYDSKESLAASARNLHVLGDYTQNLFASTCDIITDGGGSTTNSILDGSHISALAYGLNTGGGPVSGNKVTSTGGGFYSASTGLSLFPFNGNVTIWGSDGVTSHWALDNSGAMTTPWKGIFGSGLSAQIAQLKLTPSSVSGVPTGSAHVVGEMFMSALGELSVCVVAGTPGSWVQLSQGPAASQQPPTAQLCLGAIPTGGIADPLIPPTITSATGTLGNVATNGGDYIYVGYTFTNANGETQMSPPTKFTWAALDISNGNYGFNVASIAAVGTITGANFYTSPVYAAGTSTVYPGRASMLKEASNYSGSGPTGSRNYTAVGGGTAAPSSNNTATAASTAVSCSLTGTDSHHKVSLVMNSTITGAAGGALVQVRFGSVYPSAPLVTLTPDTNWQNVSTGPGLQAGTETTASYKLGTQGAPPSNRTSTINGDLNFNV